MRGWLIDAYRNKNSIVLWLKTPKNECVEIPYTIVIYAECGFEPILRSKNILYRPVVKQTYLREQRTVLEIPVPSLSSYESFVRELEQASRYRIPLYNADIPPEQHYLYVNNLVPFTYVDLNAQTSTDSIPLTVLNLLVVPYGDARTNPTTKIKSITIDGEIKKADERTLLLWFLQRFGDPDVIRMRYAFSLLPYLEHKLNTYGMQSPFHRWDATPITYKGGKSYYSYGQVRYQDHAIRLRGRLLIDTTTMAGGIDVESIIELCQLSGCTFQQTASRSFGAVFQNALIKQLLLHDYLVPHKQKPIQQPMSMFELLKADRAGHTFDAQTGFHKNIAEIDFSSMYPWLIYNKNISADTILTNNKPLEHVPGTTITVSCAHQGLVPKTIKPFLDRRMYYKQHPTALNKKKAAGLKWVLVTSYGYLRFREFKLGLPSSHMAIGAYARETLLAAARLAEEKGFEVVHGIVDSLYIKKKNLTETSVRAYCEELEQLTGIPVSYDLFKWVVFLPSIIDNDRPVPTKYYGIFANGEPKIRGIELRQHKPPPIVKEFQQDCIDQLSSCTTKKDIIAVIPELCKTLRETMRALNRRSVRDLALTVKISKTNYKNNIPQKKILAQLAKKGITIYPGQYIHYVHARDKIVLPEALRGKPNTKEYRKLLTQALYVLVQPFISKDKLLAMTYETIQTTLDQFHAITIISYPILRAFRTKRGLSEKIIRKKLERHGWFVWRGSMIHVTAHDYPNVDKKYKQLQALLSGQPHANTLRYYSRIHHGMPDFLCYKNGRFKFVECKLSYERLSARQKTCIAKLQNLGFVVELHRLVEKQTKDRTASFTLGTQMKTILQRQQTLVAYH